MALEKSSFTRRELYDLVWKVPVETLAKEFGLSGRGLGKLCERNGIPVPPRGYWARKAAGRRIVKPPLIDVQGAGNSDATIIRVQASIAKGAGGDQGEARETRRDPFKDLWAEQVKEIPAPKVPATLASPHPMVAAWLEEDRRRKNDSFSTFGGGSSWSWYDTPLDRRRLRILSTLFKELEARGLKVAQDGYRRAELRVRHGHDEITFELSERIRQYRRELTAEERADRWRADQKWTQVREPTGELVLKIKSFMPSGIPSSWQDEADDPLEQQLNRVLAGMVVAIAYQGHLREEHAAAERRRWEAAEIARKKEAERQAELARKKRLRDDAGAWRQAAEIRDFVAAVRAALSNGTPLDQAQTVEAWSAWALAHADELDPLASPDSLQEVLARSARTASDSV